MNFEAGHFTQIFGRFTQKPIHPKFKTIHLLLLNVSIINDFIYYLLLCFAIVVGTEGV